MLSNSMIFDLLGTLLAGFRLQHGKISQESLGLSISIPRATTTQVQLRMTEAEFCMGLMRLEL